MNSAVLERQYKITPAVWRLREKADKKVELERYFNDLYQLFIKKITCFALESVSSEEDYKRMRSLLEELIRTKKLLEYRDSQ